MSPFRAPLPSPLRLLIAEEDPAERGALLAAADGMGSGVTVTAAESPNALCETVARARPDVVYVGLTRPDGDWTRALTELQSAGRFVGAVVVVDAERNAERLCGVVQAIREASADAGRPTDRLAVHTGGRITLVRVDELCWIEGAGTYLRLHTRGQVYLLRESLQRLAQRLDGRRFVRIHRSTIVNVDCVRSLEHESRGEYRVYLNDGTELKLTRSYRDRLPQLTGGALG